MQLGRSLLKKPVISVTNGRNLGSVDDIYLSGGLDQVTGLYLGTSGGIFNRTACLVAYERVVRLGDDVVLVEDDEVVEGADQFAQVSLWTRLSKLRGREVDTTGGTRIGTIDDVILGEKGKVIGYSLGQVYAEGPLSQKRAIAMDVVTDLGHDGAMTIDLARAEAQELSL